MLITLFLLKNLVFATENIKGFDQHVNRVRKNFITAKPKPSIKDSVRRSKDCPNPLVDYVSEESRKIRLVEKNLEDFYRYYKRFSDFNLPQKQLKKNEEQLKTWLNKVEIFLDIEHDVMNISVNASSDDEVYNIQPVIKSEFYEIMGDISDPFLYKEKKETKESFKLIIKKQIYFFQMILRELYKKDEYFVKT